MPRAPSSSPPVPADTPLPSLTLADDLEPLLLLTPHALPSDQNGEEPGEEPTGLHARGKGACVGCQLAAMGRDRL